MNQLMPEAVLDANILLRYLTDEPRALADRVAHILEAAHRQRIGLVVTSLTLAEVVYVLESVYRWERKSIAERLLALIEADVLQFVEHDTVVQALVWYRDHAAVHFADAYVAALAVAQGHGVVISFDRGLRRVPGVTLVQAPADLRRD